MLIFFLLFLFITTRSLYPMAELSPTSPNLKLTFRLHLCSNPRIYHYSTFNAEWIRTRISTPYFWVEKVALLTNGQIETVYEGKHKALAPTPKSLDIPESNAKLIFDSLKKAFNLAEEPNIFDYFFNNE